MTNANPYLPPRRRLPAGNTPDTVAAPAAATEPATAVEPAPEAARATDSTGNRGSTKARRLRATLRQENGFFSAVQTAELLQPPLALRQHPRG